MGSIYASIIGREPINIEQAKQWFASLPKDELYELVDALEEKKLEEVISLLPTEKKFGVLSSLLGKNSGLTVVNSNSYSATGSFIQINGLTDLSDLVRQIASQISNKASA